MDLAIKLDKIQRLSVHYSQLPIAALAAGPIVKEQCQGSTFHADLHMYEGSTQKEVRTTDQQIRRIYFTHEFNFKKKQMPYST